jgi:hypothetical protein
MVAERRSLHPRLEALVLRTDQSPHGARRRRKSGAVRQIELHIRNLIQRGVVQLRESQEITRHQGAPRLRT